MKASLWILRLSSRGSNCNCCSNEVTLVLQEYEESIHLAAVHCIFSSLFESALVYGSHITDTYSMPERTSVIYASFLQSTGELLRLRLTNPSFSDSLVVCKVQKSQRLNLCTGYSNTAQAQACVRAL